MPYDERPLPTLQSPAGQHSPLSDTQRSPNSLDTSGEPEPLSEMAQRQAGLAVEVFGESLVRKKGKVVDVKSSSTRAVVWKGLQIFQNIGRSLFTRASYVSVLLLFIL